MKLRNLFTFAVLAAAVSLFVFSDAEAAKYKLQQRIPGPGGPVKTVTKVKGPARVLRRTSVSTYVERPQPVTYHYHYQYTPVYHSSYGCY